MYGNVQTFGPWIRRVNNVAVDLYFTQHTQMRVSRYRQIRNIDLFEIEPFASLLVVKYYHNLTRVTAHRLYFNAAAASEQVSL